MTDEDHVRTIRAGIDRATAHGSPGSSSLWGILRFTAKWRSAVLAHAFLAGNGPVILA